MARKPAKTMKGKNESTTPMIIPRGVYRITEMGSSTMPRFINTPLIRPVRPSTGRSENVRINSEIMNGRMKSRITACRARRGTWRLTKTAIGKPNPNDTTTATAE